MKNNIYRIKQAELREKAIEYSYSQEQYSYAELAEITEYFMTEGRKYGLLKEFRDEGIL